MVALKSADIEKYLARPNPQQPIVLVFGPDVGLVAERVQTIVKRLVDDPHDPFMLARIDGDTLAETPDRLVEEAHTVPLFGGRRAVWVKAGNRNFTAAVERLINAPPASDCRVLIEGGDLRRSAPLRIICESSPLVATLACYPDAADDIARLIDEEMGQAGLTITTQARALLSSSVGGDRLASRSELRKLALFAHGQASVDVDEVLAVVADTTAFALDGIAEAALAGEGREADQRYARARSEGTPPSVIIAGALRHVALLHRGKLAVEAGTPVGAVVKDMRINFRRAKFVETALQAWSAARLQKAMAQLADAALEARRRPELSDAVASRVLLSITHAARRQR